MTLPPIYRAIVEKMSLVGACLICGLSGCQLLPVGDSNGDGAGRDTNQNGFIDITPPDGVTFDTPNNVKIRLRNELTAADLAAFAEPNGVDASLIGLADFRIQIAWTLQYDNGETQVIESEERLSPFTQSIEFACPRDADLSVDVIVGLPVPGTAPIAVVPIDFDLDSVNYQCGDTIEYRSFVNANGQPEQSVIIN